MEATRLPGFTAAASLYKASGHYQTGGHAVNSPAQSVSAIYPTVIFQPGEVIEVHGEAPQEPWGLPWEWPWGGSGGSGTTPGVPSGDGPHGPGVGGVPSKPDTHPKPKEEEIRCDPWDVLCNLEACANAAKHEACERQIDKCVADHCKGKTHSELGKCQNACNDIVSAQPVCKADPCFEGVPCETTPDGKVCHRIRGCPGWNWGGLGPPEELCSSVWPQ